MGYLSSMFLLTLVFIKVLRIMITGSPGHTKHFAVLTKNAINRQFIAGM